MGIFWDPASGIVYQVDMARVMSEKVRQGDRIISEMVLLPRKSTTWMERPLEIVSFSRSSAMGKPFSCPLRSAAQAYG